jgi:translation elongation factor EF-Tu-like GTPase
MENKFKFKCLVELSSTENGGRTKGILQNYKPHVKIGDVKHTAVFDVEQEELACGSSAIAKAAFLFVDAEIDMNKQYQIFEGNHHVGYVTFLEVL